MTDWKSISTAPRDGTLVDLWHKDNFRITEVWWCEQDECWSCAMDDEDFTHWMSLPRTPQGEVWLQPVPIEEQ